MEYFKLCGTNIKICNSNKTLELGTPTGKYNTAYGAVDIHIEPNKKYLWVMQIIEKGGQFIVGIDESKCQHTNTSYWDQKYKQNCVLTANYSYCFWNSQKYSSDVYGASCNAGNRFGANEVVLMLLKYDKLYFHATTLKKYEQTNNEKINWTMAFDQIRKKTYRLAVSMRNDWGTSSSLKLLSFNEKTNILENDDEKHQLFENENELKQKIKLQQINYQNKVSTLNKKYHNEKNRNDIQLLSNEQLTDEIKELQHRNNELLNESKSLQDRNKRSKLNFETITQQMNEMTQVNSALIASSKDENAKKTVQLNEYEKQIEEQKISIELIKKK
eukprot:194753_1